jgi:protein phosphatase
MLVCPHCQFDNPNHNLFCQHCGESLTFHNCHECGQKVSFSESLCPNCGAMTGVSLWAIVTAVSEEELAVSEGDYLDIGQRYRLEKSLTGPDGLFPDWRGRAIDCQPLQKSVLKVLLDDRAEPLERSTVRSGEGPITSWLPQLAVPYLLLKDLYPSVPELHEAWHEGEKEVILLDDRSVWLSLTEVIAQERPPLPQTVYWFDEIAKLWKALSEVGCCQSLLVKENLRLDEDRAIGLQQLIPDRPEAPPSLSTLADLWREWLPTDQDSHLAPLQAFLARLQEGDIETVTQLRLELQELGEEETDFDEPDSGELQGEIEESSDFLSEERSSPLEESSVITIHGMTSIEAEEDGDRATAVVPMRLLSLTDAGGTDIGRSRRHNEDYFGITSEVYKQQNNRERTSTGQGLYIVCDGMGGHASGEVASSLAVNTLQEYFAQYGEGKMPDREAIEQGIFLANHTIYQVNQEKDSYGSGRMGTTLVLTLVRDTTVAIAHVGDSRIYRVNRKWGLEQLTVDHEVGQRAIQDGIDPAIAYARPDAYQLTQALGPHDNQYVKPDIRIFDIHEDTLFLLCSDGLSDNGLVEAHWQTHLSPFLSTSANLDEGLQELIALANHKNGHDNITVVLIRVKVQPNMEAARSV